MLPRGDRSYRQRLPESDCLDLRIVATGHLNDGGNTRARFCALPATGMLRHVKGTPDCHIAVFIDAVNNARKSDTRFLPEERDGIVNL
jgi:hypothetical protein